MSEIPRLGGTEGRIEQPPGSAPRGVDMTPRISNRFFRHMSGQTDHHGQAINLEGQKVVADNRLDRIQEGMTPADNAAASHDNSGDTVGAIRIDGAIAGGTTYTP